MSNIFRTKIEAENYLLLHEQGIEVLDAKTKVGTSPVNAWADLGWIRIKHTDEGMVVRTFKKYATAARALLAEA